MSRAQAKDQPLYDRVVADAKRKFDVWPSIPASSWVVAEYKRRGGTYRGKKPGGTGGLEKWYDEEWVDLARSTDSKGRVKRWVQCARPKQGSKQYPKCVPLARARAMTPAQRIAAVKRKRKVESKPKRGKARAPRRAATMNGSDRIGTPMILAELRGLSSMAKALEKYAQKERLPTWAEYKIQRAQLNLRGAASKVAYGTGLKLKPNDAGYMARVNLTQIAEDADYMLSRLARDTRLPEWMEHIIHAAHADVERVYTRFVRVANGRQSNPTVPRLEYVAKTYPLNVFMQTAMTLLEALGLHDLQADLWGDYLEVARAGGGSEDLFDLPMQASDGALAGSTRYDRYLPFVAQSMNRAHKRLVKTWSRYTGVPGSGADFIELGSFSAPGSLGAKFDQGALQHYKDADWKPIDLSLSEREQRRAALDAKHSFHNHTSRLRGSLRALVDYAEETGDDLGQYKTQDEVERLFGLVEEHGATRALAPSQTGTVVYEFPDGWTVQELNTFDQLAAEAAVMQHCLDTYDVRDGRVYADEWVKGPGVRIFSLRDPKGRPHLTMEWDLDTFSGSQFRGKQNAWPNDEYAERMIPFRDEVLEKPLVPATAAEVSRAEKLVGRLHWGPVLLGVFRGGPQGKPYALLRYGEGTDADYIGAYYLDKMEGDFHMSKSQLDAGREDLHSLPWHILKNYDVGSWHSLAPTLFDDHSDEMLAYISNEEFPFENRWSRTHRGANPARPRATLRRHAELKRRLMR